MDLVFGSQPGLLTLSQQKCEELLSNQPIEECYAVDNQPFARGKFAAVKRCRHLVSGREFAAKVMRKRRRVSGPTPETLHEAAVLDLCRACPHIVHLQHVYDAPNESVLVLELAEGGELQSVLDRDEIPEEEHVIRFLRQVLGGLAFLHQHNIAHLDLKPQNLVLTGCFPDCDIKLCDFGISRHIARGADVREILGTPDYVAPEVLNYEPISLATDMWSVGVLAYVLLTGCTPFGGETKQETFCNITRCQLEFPDDIFENVTPAARQFISSLLVSDPSERLTAQQCLEHPWLRLGTSVDSIPATISSSDESCGVSSSSTIVPEDGDSVVGDVEEDTVVYLSSTSPGSEESQLEAEEEDLLVPFADMHLSYRRTVSLPPARWRCLTKRDIPYDPGYGSDGISEVSSTDSSSDRSSIVSLDESPLEWAAMRRYSEASALSAERLWRRAWERFLPATSGSFVTPPEHFFPPPADFIRHSGAGSHRPWEKVCNGSFARALERFKAPPSPLTAMSPEVSKTTTSPVKTAPTVSEVKTRLMKGSSTPLPQTPRNPAELKAPLMHLDKTEIVKSRLVKFRTNSATP